MAGCDAELLGTPAILPERQGVIALGQLLGVVVACYVAETEEEVWEAVLLGMST